LKNESVVFDEVIEEIIENETMAEQVLTNETFENETVLNITIENVSEISTLQYKAVIGRPVKWLKKVSVNRSGNLSVEIPAGSRNISVLTGDEIDEAEREVAEYSDLVSGADREEVSRGVLLTGNVVFDIREGDGWLVRLWNWLISFRISGDVVLEEELDAEGNILEFENVTVVNVEDVVSETNASEVAVEYYTDAPVVYETLIENGKRIVVSADDVYNYTDILAYALVDGFIEINSSKLKLYWYDNETRISIEYFSHDFDDDGFVDYVEWIVPHLSNQTYELVIEIVVAEHLDENRTFIRDVYNETSVLDDSWVEVNDSQYVRVTFEQTLDKTRDITIYARSGNNETNESVNVEVYLEDGNNTIARFENITEAEYYKIYLTSLSENESYSVFDLKVLGDVEFDYIVDPASLYNLTFVAPTPESGATTSYAEVNISLKNASDLKEFVYNWNGTNYSIYNDSLVLMYNFDNVSVLGESNTKVVDLSGNGNNGTPNGNVWNASGKYGGAFEFDATKDNIDAGSGASLDLGNSFTVSAWIKPDSLIAYGGIVSKTVRSDINHISWIFGCNVDGSLVAFSPTGFVWRGSSSTGITVGNWYYVSWVISGGNVYFYVDGKAYSSGAFGYSDFTASNVYIGSWYSGNDAYDFDGKIDEVRIWNRSLSSGEIHQMYISNLNKYDSGKWLFYSDVFYVLPGNYTYQVFAKDSSNSWNSSEQRSVLLNSLVYQMSDTTPNLTNLSLYRVPKAQSDVATFSAKDSSFLNTSTSIVDKGNNSHVFDYLFDGLTVPVFDFSWKGYGETTLGYPVTFYVYNFSSNSWQEQLSQNITSNTEKFFEISGINYFSPTNVVFVWVKAMSLVYQIPIISGVSAVAYGGGNSVYNDNYCTMSWTTNVNAYSVIAYGSSSQTSWNLYTNFDNDDSCSGCADSSTNGTVVGDGYGTAHSITTPANLLDSTTYYYRVKSCSDPIHTVCNTSAQGTCVTGSSCPFIYVWNGTEWIFDSEAITAFPVIKENEGKQPSRLPSLKSFNGTYKVIISEELDEKSYIDSIELLKVKHSEDIEVYTGFREEAIGGYPQLFGKDVPLYLIKNMRDLYDKLNEFNPENPSFTFKFYTIRDKVKPISVTEKGENVEELMEMDGKFWNNEERFRDIKSLNLTDSDNDSIVDTENPEDIYRTAEFVFPKQNTEKVKLLMKIKESSAFDWVSRSVYFSSLDLDNYDSEKSLKYAIREGSYRISVWDGEKWREEVFINDYPRDKASDIVVPLDIRGINSSDLRIRVRVAAKVVLLDGIYVDYSEDEKIEVEKIDLVDAKKNGFSVKEVISNSDENKIVLSKGDLTELEFFENSERNIDSTMFLNVKGYYLPTSRKGIYEIKNVSVIERLYKEGGFSPRYWYLKWGKE